MRLIVNCPYISDSTNNLLCYTASQLIKFVLILVSTIKMKTKGKVGFSVAAHVRRGTVRHVLSLMVILLSVPNETHANVKYISEYAFFLFFYYIVGPFSI